MTEQKQDEVPPEWGPGMEFLDYKVEAELGRGSFGAVHKVRHKGWNVDMAVKSALVHVPEEEIAREAEVWMELGLHPNIVSCYFVRTLGGVPRIFVEYVDGGTLHEWLTGKTNRNEDGTETVVEKPRELTRAQRLGIAIEICRGMQHAHGFEWTDRNGAKQVGLVHRDLKPLNILMTDDGVPRITDFGLVGFGPASAKDRPQQAAPASELDATLVKSIRDEGGLVGTPAYAPPEQWGGRGSIGKAADVYAFGVILYELFCGRRPFELPAELQHAVPQLKQAEYERLHCEETPPAPTSLDADIDPELSALMLQCLAKNPNDRGANQDGFTELSQKLKAIYKRLEDEDYDDLHPEPKAAELLADSLNNRALSYLEIGQPKRAEELWAKALKADPHYPESTFNLGLFHWRRGRISDQELLQRMEGVRTSHAAEWIDEYLVSLIHIERGDATSAAKLLQEAAKDSSDDPTVIAALRMATADLDKWGSLPDPPRGYADEQEIPEKYRDTKDRRGLGWSVSYSADGRFICRQMGDSTSKEPVNIYELGTHKRLCRLLTGGQVRSFCVSADRRIMLSPGRAWDVATRQCLYEVAAGAPLCVTPDGKQALFLGSDNTIGFWDLRTPRCLCILQGHEGRVTCACLSRDARYALSGAEDRTLRLWSLPTGTCIRTFRGHSGTVLCVSLSTDARTALSGSLDRTLCAWQVSTGERIHTLRGHTGQIRSIFLSADGNWALSTAHDNTVRLWQISDGRCLRTFDRWSHSSVADIYALFLGTESHTSRMQADDGSLQPWVFRRAQESRAAPFLLCRCQQSVTQTKADSNFERHLDEARVALHQNRIAHAHSLLLKARTIPGRERHPGALDLWASLSQKAQRVVLKRAYFRRALHGPSGGCICVSLSSDGRTAVAGGAENTLWVWEAVTDKSARCLQGHEDHIRSVCVSPDGRWALSGSGDRTVRMWDIRQGTCRHILRGHKDVISSLGMSADARWGLSGGWDGTVRLWDLVTGMPLRVFQGRGPVSLSEDGRWALFNVAGDDGACGSVWDVSNGRQICRFERSGSRMNARCLSGDGTFVFSTNSGYSTERTPFLWDTETGTLTRVFQGECHGSSGHTPYLSPDDRWGISGGIDHNTRVISIWDVAAGRCVGCFGPQAGNVNVVTATADGRWVLSVTDDWLIRLWELEWGLAIQDASDWDEGARLYLVRFLTLHTPYAGIFSAERKPSEMEIGRGLTRFGKPIWDETDFKKLLHMLGCAGYGWLRMEGVRKTLEEMTASWSAPPPLPWKVAGSEQRPKAIQVSSTTMPSSSESDTVRRDATPGRLPTKSQAELGRPDRERARALGDSERQHAQSRPGMPRNAPCPCGSGKKYKQCHGREVVTEQMPGSESTRPGLGPQQRVHLRPCSCGHQNPPANKFCTGCGKQLPKAIGRTCRHCGKTLPTTVAFCVHCGKRIDA